MENYFIDGCGPIIRKNGADDNYTPLMHAFNVFLEMFWRDYHGGAYWPHELFLDVDVRETTSALVNEINKPFNNSTIGLLSVIENIKPSTFKYGHYKHQMVYVENGREESPRHFFYRIMHLLNVDSLSEIAKEEAKKFFKEKGLPFTSINSNFINDK